MKEALAFLVGKIGFGRDRRVLVSFKYIMKHLRKDTDKLHDEGKIIEPSRIQTAVHTAL